MIYYSTITKNTPMQHERRIYHSRLAQVRAGVQDGHCGRDTRFSLERDEV